MVKQRRTDEVGAGKRSEIGWILLWGRMRLVANGGEKKEKTTGMVG